MPNLNHGELWEQSLRLKARRLFPRITITKAPSGHLQILDKRGVKRKAKNIPITWEKENAEEIIDEIYFYLNLPKNPMAKNTWTRGHFRETIIDNVLSMKDLTAACIEDYISSKSEEELDEWIKAYMYLGAGAFKK